MEKVIENQANGATSSVFTPITHGITVGDGWSIFVGGTFSSATAQVEVAPTANGPWAEPEELSFTANGIAITDFTPKLSCRLTTSGGDGSTEVSLWIGQGS